jgi:hypothetical protein
LQIPRNNVVHTFDRKIACLHRAQPTANPANCRDSLAHLRPALARRVFRTVVGVDQPQAGRASQDMGRRDRSSGDPVCLLRALLPIRRRSLAPPRGLADDRGRNSRRDRNCRADRRLRAGDPHRRQRPLRRQHRHDAHFGPYPAPKPYLLSLASCFAATLYWMLTRKRGGRLGWSLILARRQVAGIALALVRAGWTAAILVVLAWFGYRPGRFGRTFALRPRSRTCSCCHDAAREQQDSSHEAEKHPEHQRPSRRPTQRVWTSSVQRAYSALA